VLRRLLAPGDISEQTPHDLARASLRQRLGETDFVRSSQGADLLDDVLGQLFLQFIRWRHAAAEGHKTSDAFAFDLVRPTYYGGLGDFVVMNQSTLHFHRAQPMAGDVEHVIDAAHDPEIAVLVLPGAVRCEVSVRNLAPVLLPIAL